MANLISNLKVITSGKVPTVETLAKGGLAFGKVGEGDAATYKLYGNSIGTEVHEFLTITEEERSKLTNVPTDTNAELGKKANQSDLDATNKTVAGKADKTTVDTLTKTVEGKLDSVVAGTNVVIDNKDPKNPIINVAQVELPDKYSSTDSQSGSIGDTKTGLNYADLTGIGTEKAAGTGDTVVFANGVQAQITAVHEATEEGGQKTYDAIIISIPVATTWGSIAGSLDNQADLKTALDAKANKSDIPTVSDATVNIKEGNSLVGSFSLNKADATDIVRNTFTTTDVTSAELGGTGGPFNGELVALDAPAGATIKVGDTLISGDYKILKITKLSSDGKPSGIVTYVPKPQQAVAWGNITGDITSQADLKEALDAKANKADIETPGKAVITVNAYGSKLMDFGVNDTQNKTINIPEPTINLVVAEI